MVFEKISSLDRYDLRNEKFTEALADVYKRQITRTPVSMSMIWRRRNSIWRQLVT